ncbi:unnamed protein product [Candida verbasci]|uniref:HMG box domain-containing protein n=1 Tax=Candida verbasci TaxID=1227364 RepID=A0A9W4XEH5_9ASCO|nr:unnamed protein product [Candida verbasci]
MSDQEAERLVVKDAFVASLVELSKVAVKTAEKAIDFANAFGGSQQVDVSSIKSVKLALDNILSSGVKRERDASDAVDSISKKKKKVERDPNAPKKPLTMFFAFSYDLRKKIGEERKRKGESSLSAIETNQTIKEAWDSLPDSERSKWKKKYDDEMIIYREEAKKYEDSLKNGTEYHATLAHVQSPPIHAPKVEEVEVDESEDESDEEEEVPAPPPPAPEEKKKKKKDKKDKKKKS